MKPYFEKWFLVLDKLKSRLIEFARPFIFVNLIFYFVIFLFVVLGVVFLKHYMSGDDEGYTQFFILLTVSVTFLTLIYNVRRHISEDYFKDAKEHLKKAYDALSPKDGETKPPNNRLTWLTAARFLKTAEKLSNKIIMASHKDMYREERQYWRMKFLEIVKDFPENYYAESPEKMLIWGVADRRPLSESSLVVVYKFIEWSDDYIDPLEKVTFTDTEIHDMRHGSSVNLGTFLAKVRELRKKR
jgi:hypothetical protein